MARPKKEGTWIQCGKHAWKCNKCAYKEDTTGKTPTPLDPDRTECPKCGQKMIWFDFGKYQQAGSARGYVEQPVKIKLGGNKK